MSYQQVPTADNYDRRGQEPRSSDMESESEEDSPTHVAYSFLRRAKDAEAAAPATLQPFAENKEEHDEEEERLEEDEQGRQGSTVRLKAVVTAQQQPQLQSHFRPIKDRRKSTGLTSPPELRISTLTPAARTAAADSQNQGFSSSLYAGSGNPTPRSGKLTALSSGGKSSKCTSFIKLIGAPKPVASNDPNIQATCETPLALGAGGHPVKPTAADARAADALDAECLSRKIVDVLDAQNEDPFTLEPFESLMRVHTEEDKDFILARVTTADPLDDNKVYYSYYAAHHINKVLFRTQPEANLLHRMKAKNPLNNMTIVGDVHYYVFMAEQGKAMGLANSKPASRCSHDSERLGSMASRTSRDFTLSPRRQWATSVAAGGLRSPSAILASIRHLLTGEPQEAPRKRLRMFVPSDLLYDMGEEGGDNGKPGGDRRFKRTARRLSADDIYTALVPPLTAVGAPTPAPTIPRLPALPSATAINIPPRISAPTATATAAPMSAGVVRTSFVPRGLKYHTVRSISYMNDQEGATDPYDWVRHHLADGLEDVGWDGRRVDQREKLSIRTLGGAVVIPGIGNAKQRTPLHVEENRPPTPGAKVKQPESAGTVGSVTPAFYEFRYYGSDDDFLMKSAVRQYFKQHALEAADAVLFTISTGTNTTVPAGGDLEEHPALLGFQYLIDGTGSHDDGAAMSGACGRWYVKIVILLYVALAVVLVRFVVSDSYTYLVAFLLVFLLCFLLIFFVDILERSRGIRNIVANAVAESSSGRSE